ncbi:MAG TPA: c-type cytochrome [Hyphomicrobiaceae bacterium]
MPSSRRCRARRGLAASAPLVLWVAAGPCPSGAQTLQDKIAACAACHGEAGQPQDANVPSIGGQPKLFVMYQLFFYREGRRTNPEMNTIAKDMNDTELTAISEYVAGLPAPPPASGAIDETRYRRGAALADKRICGACHNADYSGREQMPRLAGQGEAYLLKSLKQYEAGTRVGTQAAMAEAVRGLSDGEFADLAYYLAHFRR